MSLYIFDSREQKNEHIKRYFNQNNIEFVEQKLNEGDYQLDSCPHFSVDRKQNLDELLTNLCSKDKSRFWREVRRAKEKGIKLIILCEHGNGIEKIVDVAKWKSQYSKVTGRKLVDKIYQCHIAYGVEFLFCNKTETARKIIELLE